MTTLTVTLTNICPGGNHLTFTVSGAVSGSRMMELSSLSDPLTQDDMDSFLQVIAKMAKGGRTLAQARTLLQAGVTVTV